VVTDSNGTFVDSYDIGAHLSQEEKPGMENEMAGFNVWTGTGTCFYRTYPFLAFRLTRDNQIESFGGPGNLARESSTSWAP
jgi:hypothetical protein